MPVGAPGAEVGETPADAADAGPVPTALVAVTVKVSALPPGRPVTWHVVAGAFTVHVFVGSWTLVTV